VLRKAEAEAESQQRAEVEGGHAGGASRSLLARHAICNSGFSVGGAAVVADAYAVCARRTERRDVHVAEALGGAAEGSYEQVTR
jgi:hypothetical protein